MDNSALNAAHFHGRKAESHLKYRHYDQACQSHQAAIEQLELATNSTSNQKSIESLRLQINYHMRQMELIKLKKAQHDRYKAATEQKSVLEYLMRCKWDTVHQLQVDLLHTVEHQNDLLATLVEENKESTVAAELIALNHQMNAMVGKLIDRFDGIPSPSRKKSSPNEQPEAIKEIKIDFRQAIETITRSMEEGQSGSSSPEAVEAQEDLPALAPLELPDLNTLQKDLFRDMTNS